MVEIYYTQQPIHKYTFQAPKIKKFVEENSKGKTLNLFAGKTRLNINETRIDTNNKYNPDYNMDAYTYIQYAKNIGEKYDTIILDPPYSLRKSMEKYQGHQTSKFQQIKKEIPSILKDDGIIISLGYHSTCMGESNGFQQSKILLIGHGGAIHDTICLIEKKVKKG